MNYFPPSYDAPPSKLGRANPPIARAEKGHATWGLAPWSHGPDCPRAKPQKVFKLHTLGCRNTLPSTELAPQKLHEVHELSNY